MLASPVPMLSPARGRQKRKKRWVPHLGQAGLCRGRSYMEDGKRRKWTKRTVPGPGMAAQKVQAKSSMRTGALWHQGFP